MKFEELNGTLENIKIDSTNIGRTTKNYRYD